MRMSNQIKLVLTRFVDEDYERKHSVLTIHIDNSMIQKTGMEAEVLYYCIKDLLEPGEEIIFEEDKENEK